MNLSEKIERLKDMEVEIQMEVNGLKETLASSIAEEKMNGVTVINDGSDGGPKIATVKFSTVSANRGCNLTPEFYIPRVQAEAVLHKLDSCGSVKQLCKAVASMIEEKRVKRSGSIGDYVYLNDETVRILKGSDLAIAYREEAE